ncbi:MAG: class I SAM-dependent DNA methyltransferase, partial [Candidatus Heimdallarchaeota archaeon]|nr:class I SAM-dependent DNA methyltransferase [Candidatus Heimdallarchaeota archaeon]
MFLSSFEKLRGNILNNDTIMSMIHLGPHAFDSIGGEVVSTTAFVIETEHHENLKGAYLRLIDGRNEAEKQAELKAKRSEPFYASTADFKKIPGSPIAYWINPDFFDIFKTIKTIDNISPPRIGMMTTDNNRFLRLWFELQINKIGFNCSSIHEAMDSETKWFPYNKGGNYRKWAGNSELVVNWYKGGEEIKNAGMTSFRGKEYYFKEGITWGDVSSSIFSCRYTNAGKMFDIKGTSCFPSSFDLPIIMSVLNSKIGTFILKFLNPTISFQSGDIRRIPIPYDKLSTSLSPNSINHLIEISQFDWDSYETSWDFTTFPLLQSEYHQPTLQTTYAKLRAHWHEMTLEMQRLEEENNRIFIEAYGLQDELTPDV